MICLKAMYWSMKTGKRNHEPKHLAYVNAAFFLSGVSKSLPGNSLCGLKMKILLQISLDGLSDDQINVTLQSK